MVEAIQRALGRMARARPPEGRGSKQGNSAASLIYYINSGAIKGGATSRQTTATQKGSVNEGVIRKDNE